ncbi:beta-amyrin 28-monooxygenase-like [Punica granatum]|uniref:Beta-amyrin 28-monooxygenase-like n=1 Tax=Punica granatum TaxID=22663 RepID=A0A6P8CU15_PUNGR|nr:beta-amyrin 28-monooxygenase-like [Punica granatum]
MARQHLEADWPPHEDVRVFPLLKKDTLALSCRPLMRVQDPACVTRLAHTFALATAGIMLAPLNFPGTAYNKAIHAGKSLRFDLLPIIKRTKKEIMENKDMVAKDFLSRMLLAEDENGQPVMKETEIGNTIITKLLASHESSSTMITFVVKYLAEHPNVYERVLKGTSRVDTLAAAHLAPPLLPHYSLLLIFEACSAADH